MEKSAVNEPVKKSVERHAACSCGQLQVTVDADPVRVSVCHCFACQRRTGSVFGAQARFPLESLRTDGLSSQFRRIGDSGAIISFNFCPHCGATVYYTLDSFPDLVAVPVGAFADPDFPQPAFSVYESSMHHWVTVPADVEHSDS